MAKFSLAYQNITLNTAADIRTLVTFATAPASVLKLYEVSVSGEAGSSSVDRLAINRATTLGITITGITPEKLDAGSIAPTANAYASTWGTQPVLSTNDVLSPTINGFGGVYRWVAPPDSEIVVGGLGTILHLSYRPRSGNTVVSGHLFIEER